LQEVLDSFSLEFFNGGATANPKILVIDCTFGRGGHSREILLKFPNAVVLGIDQDKAAIEYVKNSSKEKDCYAQELEKFYNEGRLYLLHENMANTSIVEKTIHSNTEIKNLPVAFILMDLGISSPQIDNAERGFSFLKEGPLDMRMNQENQKITAADLINNLNEEELIEIFMKWGEEKFGLAKKISKKIVEEREKEEIISTSQLEKIIFHSYPPVLRHKKTHPATKIFQALRIEVNQELSILPDALEFYANMLNSGGNFSVISFHSLEDRIVKHKFRKLVLDAKNFSLITKKPIIPQTQEISDNPRARSAKLRVLKRNFLLK